MSTQAGDVKMSETSRTFRKSETRRDPDDLAATVSVLNMSSSNENVEPSGCAMKKEKKKSSLVA